MLEPTIPPPTMTTSAVCILCRSERPSILAHAAGGHPAFLKADRAEALASPDGHVPRQNAFRLVVHLGNLPRLLGLPTLD